MKILVVSDTHKNYQALKAVVDKVDFDILVHLGDGEHEFNDIRRLYPDKGMIYVGGNCDYGQHELSHVAKIGGVKIFCCHGHTFGVHDGLEHLAAAAKQEGCNVALFGHTHLHRTDKIDGVLLMNPGSLDSPRGKNKPSFGIISIEPDGEIKMNILAVSTNRV
ncbi:MAG TPA: YfcE family phosphodiesterase [Ruminococcaceae bacterium]|nr:YfcE family phosphodiesterase [Oscillospiraceae bacterium]